MPVKTDQTIPSPNAPSLSKPLASEAAKPQTPVANSSPVVKPASPVTQAATPTLTSAEGSKPQRTTPSASTGTSGKKASPLGKILILAFVVVDVLLVAYIVYRTMM